MNPTGDGSAKGWDFVNLAGILLACLAAGYVGSLANSVGMDWYDTLIKPPGTPPGWLFGVAWTILYFLMAFSAWLVSRSLHDKRSLLLTIFSLQLIANLTFSFFFFALRSPLAGFVNIVVLTLLVALYLVLSRPVSKLASYLFLPYLLWLFYAAYLNLGVIWLN